MQHALLSVAAQFSETPGPRRRSQGRFSAEEFLEVHLAPAFEAALADGKILVVDLNDAAGYSAGFLEGSFGGLTRRFGHAIVKKHLLIVYRDEPYLTEDINEYIDEAELSGPVWAKI